MREEEVSMKQVTIYDIAREANVSISTVSRVLNNTAPVKQSTREKIIALISKYHFQPNALARSLIKKMTGMIGVILPDITNPFYPEVLSGLEKEARKNGYNFFLCDTGSVHEQESQYERETQYLNILQEKQVDGLIFIGGRINLTSCKPEWVKEVVEVSKRIPIVLINGELAGTSLHGVVVEEMLGAEMATQHLIDLGHRDIAFIGGYKHMSTTLKRVQGFRTSMKRSGLPIHGNRIMHGGFTVDSGQQLMREILHMGMPPTAIFCVNDLVAIGAIKIAVKSGLQVPRDISVIGFDDIPFASNSIPELTTVSLKGTELGRKAAEMLHKLISKETTTLHDILLPEMVIRESTAPIAKSINTNFV